MNRARAHGGYAFASVAEMGERFVDFAPYVPSISDAGVVAFQATLRGGGSGVYTCDGRGEIATVIESGSGVLREVVSHPDISAAGAVCFYGVDEGGRREVYTITRGATAAAGAASGALGPTMNEAGAVAFRDEGPGGRSGVCVWRDGSIERIAEVGGVFAGFQGLPVINATGQVAFRADLVGGSQAILMWERGQMKTVVENGERFATLGFFPSMNDSGEVAFTAVERDGGGRHGVFVARDRGESIERIVSSGDGFESFRGGLINTTGVVVFYATPPAGTVGVYTRGGTCVLSMGGEFFGSTVADFALNPVSVNEAGQLAVRVRLADGRHLIVRGDPRLD